MKQYLSGSLVTVAFFSMLSTASANLLVNPSFEDPSIAPPAFDYLGAPGWTPAGGVAVTTNSTNTQYPVPVAHAGTQFLKMIGNGQFGAFQSFTAVAGETYEFSIWVMNLSDDPFDGWGLIAVDFVTSDGFISGNPTSFCTPSYFNCPDPSVEEIDVYLPPEDGLDVSDWTQLIATETAPVNTVQVNAIIIVIEGSGVLFVDDARLTKVPAPPALWLFGSGLLGLVGIARRKKAA